MKMASWNEWLRSHIEEVLKEIGIEKGQKVLDFGCGSGAYAIPLAKLVGKNGKIYALDKHSESLKALEEKAIKEGLENIETIISSNLQTSLEKKSVDVVLLYDVIHLINDRTRLFTEIYRILKVDGFVSMYPMHVEKSEVLRQMQKSNFYLEAEKYEGNILHFRKI